MVLVRVVLAVISTGQKKVKGAKVNLIQKRDTAIIPIKNPKVAAASPIRMVKVTIVLKENMAMVIRNPKVAKVSPIHTEKVITVLRAIMAIRNPRVAKVSPIHMVKAAMAIRVVMENLMAIKKHQPMEVMGDMDRVLLNMSCIISTN